MTAKTGIILAGLLGLLGVAAGAFGAHGLQDRVGARELEIWRTGAHYQQVHAVLLLVVAVWATYVGQRGGPTTLHGVAMTLLVAGMVVFSGTLYAMTLGGPRILGAIPLGGLCLLGGWATVALIGLRSAPVTMDATALFPERDEQEPDADAVARVGPRDGLIIGAAVAGERLAWVEQSNDDDYTLHMHADGARREWVVDTYNPFFGCTVHALRWYGDTLSLVYTEKHHTIAATLDFTGPPRLRALRYAWAIVGDTILYASDARGLVEQLRLPDLAPGPPLPAAVAAVHLSAGTDPTGPRPSSPITLAELQPQIVARLPGPARPLADLLIGALAYRYWIPWPAPSASYDEEYARRSWNEPCWLPFYAHHAAPANEARALLAALDAVADLQPTEPPTTVADLACRHLADRCRELAAACRADHLPEGTSCYFWVEWSQAEFHRDLSLFPAGMTAVWQALRPHARALAALGARR